MSLLTECVNDLSRLAKNKKNRILLEMTPSNQNRIKSSIRTEFLGSAILSTIYYYLQ